MAKVSDAVSKFIDQTIPRSLLVGSAVALTTASQAAPLVDMMSGIKLQPNGQPYLYSNTSMFSFGAQAYGAQEFIGDGHTLLNGGMYLGKTSGTGIIPDLERIRVGIWEGGYSAFQLNPDIENATKFITLFKSAGDFTFSAPTNYGGKDVYTVNLNLGNHASSLGIMSSGQTYAYAFAPVAGDGVNFQSGGAIVEGNYGASSWFYNKNVVAPAPMENVFGPEFKYGGTYLNSSAVPEPSGLAAVGMGVAALVGLRRRRKED